MTNEELIELAKKAGVSVYLDTSSYYISLRFNQDHLAEFAALIEAPLKERIAELEKHIADLESWP